MLDSWSLSMVLLMVAGDTNVQPYHPDLCCCRNFVNNAQQLLFSHTIAITVSTQHTKMAPTTKDTPLTAEEQKKWDDEVAMKMEALGNITCRERFDTFKYEENTKRHMPGEHESVGEQVAKPALWGGRVPLDLSDCSYAHHSYS